MERLKRLAVVVAVFTGGCAAGHREPCPVPVEARSVAIEEIDAAGRLDFDPARVQVLKALIRNPDFSPVAKSAILRNLHLIDFDPARSELLREMQDRGDSSREILNP